MQLQYDPACIHGLSWRLVVGGERGLERLLRMVCAAGWQESPGIGELLIYAIPGGHRLLLVPGTGRVQIRLDYRTAPHQRALVAQAIVASLERQARPDGEAGSPAAG